MAPITIYASTLSGITWRAVNGRGGEPAPADDRDQQSRQTRAAAGRILGLGCRRQGVALPSEAVRHPEIFLALLDQKLRQIEPMAVTPSVALTAAKERCSDAQPSPAHGIRRIFPGASEAIGNGRMSFPAFLAMELIEAHHPELYQREFGFRA